MSAELDKADKVGDEKTTDEQTEKPGANKKDADGGGDVEVAAWLDSLPDDARKEAEALPNDESRKAAMKLNAKLASAHERVKEERNTLRTRVSEHDAEKEAQLEANKEFETLAGDRKAKLDELNPQVETLTTEKTSLTEQLEAANGVINTLLEAEKQSLELDDSYTQLLKDKSPVEQLGWIAANREKLGKGKTGIPAVKDGKTTGPLSHEEKLALSAPVHF